MTSREAFDAVWRSLPIPGEYDAMDDLDKARWRGVVEAAYLAGADIATKRAVKRTLAAPVKTDRQDQREACAAAIRALD